VEAEEVLQLLLDTQFRLPISIASAVEIEIIDETESKIYYLPNP